MRRNAGETTDIARAEALVQGLEKDTNHWMAKHLKGDLLENYLSRASDPDYLSLKASIHLHDALMCQSLAIMEESPGHPAIWRELRNAANLYRRTSDPVKCEEYIRRMILGIDEGGRLSDAQDDLRRTMDSRRRHTDSERARLIDMHAVLTADEAVALFGAVTDAIELFVSDPDERRKIGQYLTAKAGGGSRPPSHRRGGGNSQEDYDDGPLDSGRGPGDRGTWTEESGSEP